MSESCLWTLQGQYYSELGIDAFIKVPSYGTGNATIGRVYAELILGALLDLKDQLTPGEPIYVLELGGGSGRLAQHILHHLQTSQAQFAFLDDVRYVLSDAIPSMLDFWLSQPVFEPLTASGKLDFAVFDPINQPSLTTHFQQQVIQPDSIKNPLIVVATYFFDTIAHDSFYVDNHQLNEVRISLTRDAKKYNLNTPVEVSQLQLQEKRHPVQLPYYQHPVMDGILTEYCEALEQSPLVIPTEGLRVLDNLQHLTSNEIVFITSDKGYGNPADEPSNKAMSITFHGDAFSMCVNFDAVERYITHYHGHSLYSNTPGIKTFMGFLPKRSAAVNENAFPMTSYWFQQNVVDLDLANQAINLQHMHDTDFATNLNAKFDVFTALVMTNHYDPKAFAKSVDMIRGMETLTPEQVSVLRHVLERVEANIVGTSVHDDVFFELITWHQQLGQVDQARQTYEHATRLAGVQYNLAFLVGAMYQELGQLTDALELYQQAHQALSTNTAPEAQAMLPQIQHVIQQLQQSVGA